MRLQLICNPVAGRGRGAAAAERAARALGSAGHEVRLALSEHAGHARPLAAAAARESDALLAVGGDGTLHEVANGLFDACASERVALAVLPCGSGDSFAKDLELATPQQAVERLLSGARRRVDVAELELTSAGVTRECRAIHMLAWGAAARIDRRAESLRWTGRLRYDLSTLVELVSLAPLDGVPRVDGVPLATQLLGVASLTQYSGRGMRLAPAALLDDGKLDLVQLERGPRASLARLFLQLLRGAQLRSPLLTSVQQASLELELWPGAELVLDGELVPAERVLLRMVPRAVELLA